VHENKGLLEDLKNYGLQYKSDSPWAFTIRHSRYRHIFLPCCIHKVTCNTVHLRTAKIRDHATLARITTLLDATSQQFR